MRLIDKYAPRTWSEFVGNPKAVGRVRAIIDRADFTSDAFWIAGPSGIGKSSLAALIGAQLAENWNIIEIDGEACTVDAVRAATDTMRLIPMGTDAKPFRVFVVNEAHAMTPKAVQAWLTALDRIPRLNVVIFTTTEDSQDLFGNFSTPFMDRCKQIALSSQGLSDLFALRSQEVARAENMDGKPIDAYRAQAKRCKNSLRKMYQENELGVMAE